MTEGVAVVIILLWVPPGPPSSRFSAALPKACRREKAQRGMFVARLSPIRMRTMIGFSSGPAWKKILHGWVGWGRNFWPMDQIPTNNLQESILTVTHFTEAVRAPETQKYVTMMLERIVWLLNHGYQRLEHLKFTRVLVLKRQVPIPGKLSQ